MTPPAAKLYDVRYSRYNGSREARWRSVLALTRSSTTRALGLRRTAGSKVWPFLLIGAAHLPVVAAIGIPLLVTDQITPLEIMPLSQLLVFLVPVLVAFAATTLPSLLTRERRDRVLSLYFSTAVSPWEYLVGKVLAAIALMSLVTLSPLLILLIGSVLTAKEPLDALTDQGADLPQVLLGGLVVAVYFAALGLLAGSLTAKRIFAIGGLLAVLLVTPIVFSIIAAVGGQHAAFAGDLATVSLRAADMLLPGDSPFGTDDRPPDALVWAVVGGMVLLSAAVLWFRYSEEDSA